MNYEICIEFDDGRDQETFGPYDSWQEAHEAMPEIIENYPDFQWCQIAKAV